MIRFVPNLQIVIKQKIIKGETVRTPLDEDGIDLNGLIHNSLG